MTHARVLTLVVWLVVTAACGWVVSKTTLTADLQAFLPQAPSPEQQILVDELREGVVSRLILIAIEGADPDVLAELSREFVSAAAKDPAFSFVNNGSEDLLKSDAAFLLAHRYLLSPAISPGHFGEIGLRQSLELQLQQLASPIGVMTGRLIRQDPTGEFLAIVERFESRPQPHVYDGVWVSPDRDRALIVAQTVAPGFDIDAQQVAMARISAIFDSACQTLDVTGASLITVGPGVFAVQSRDAIKSDAITVTGLAAIAIAALLLFVFRSFRSIVLISIPVVSGGLAGIAAVSMAFGTVHGITIGFGATLIGESVDYAIHLLMGSGRSGSARTSMSGIWRTLRLGVLTSIAGSAALLFSGFPGLAQLGLFSIVGLIVALGVTRWVLPALLPPEFATDIVSAWGPKLQSLIKDAGRARIPTAVLILASVTWLAFIGRAAWYDELETLSPISEADQVLDGEMRKELGAPDVRELIVVRGIDQEATLQMAETVGRALESLVRQGAIAGYDSPALYLPSKKLQSRRQGEIPGEARLRQSLSRATVDLPFKEGVFEDFVEQVQSARHADLLSRNDLPSGLASRVDSLLVRRNGAPHAILPLVDTIDSAAVISALSRFDQQRVVYVDLKRESDSLYRGYRVRILTFAIVGTVAIVMLLLAAFRSARRCLLALAPIAAALAVTVGILTVTGVALTIFHLVAMLLVVGVGSNYTLFFDQAVRHNTVRERTYVALATCNMSTVIGFGCIGFANTPVLSAMGVTVALGAALCLIFAAVFMPAAPTSDNQALAGNKPEV